MKSVHLRLVILGGLIVAFGGTVTARLADLQFARGERFQARAQKQRQQIRTLVPRRGEIFDRQGRELALSVTAEAVAAHPRQIEDPVATARALAPLLGQPAADIEARLRTDSSYVYLDRMASTATCDRVRQAALAGVVLEPWSRRVYPNRSLAAQALGFVSIDNRPLGGIELAFDSWIRGTDGRAIDLADAKGVPFAHQVLEASVPGENLGLTLDASLQHVLEEELDYAVRQAHAKGGSAVAMDPATGEVLAMASWPTFNPNTFSQFTPEQRQDRVVVTAYEPGSTFKIITAAAGLEHGLLRPDEVFYCGRGVFRIGRYTIRDHKSFADLTFTDVMARSSNVGAIKAGMRLTPEDFHEIIRRFGFGEKTGVGLPGEQAGLLRQPRDWSLLSQPSLSIGQEILVTPLQMLSAVATVANGGVMVPPWIARQLMDQEGRVLRRFEPPATRRVISERTASALSTMLEHVVNEGTGQQAAVPGYLVAGKTGTAQKSSPGGAGYEKGKYVASFVGYAPAWKPRVAAIIVVDEPGVEAYHGGDVAAPAFGRFAARVLPLMGAVPEPPQRQHGNEPERLVVRQQDTDTAGARWVTLHSSGAMAAPAAVSAAAATGGTELAGLMPDLTGLSAREAVARLTGEGLTPRLEGQGRVLAQEPMAGTPLDQAGECRLWLGL